jgi:GNAT superfamily N-acetyltransferase
MWTPDAFGFTHGTLLVAEQNERISGFVHFGPEESDVALAEIYGLYVHPAYWGSGSAQALMGQALHLLADSFPTSVLWTHAEAVRARRFYSKSGWSETGSEHQATLWDGISYPAVQYGRALTPP